MLYLLCYLRIIVNWLVIEDFNVGEIGEFLKNILDKVDVILFDLIFVFIFFGNFLDEIEI